MLTRTRPEVSDIIQRFVDRTGDTWEWDDFCSLPIYHPALEVIRGKCTCLWFTYPPSDKRVSVTQTEFNSCSRWSNPCATPKNNP
jgi:hypothetical protein